MTSPRAPFTSLQLARAGGQRARSSPSLTRANLGAGQVVRGAVLVGEGQVGHGYPQGAADRLPAVAGLPLDESRRGDLRANLPEPPLVAGHDVLRVVGISEEVTAAAPRPGIAAWPRPSYP